MSFMSARRYRYFAMFGVAITGLSFLFTNCARDSFAIIEPSSTAQASEGEVIPEDPTVESVKMIPCAQTQFEFPLSTHWSNEKVDVVEGAADTLQTSEPNKVGTRRMYNYGFIPDYDHYIGTDYDPYRYQDADFRSFSNNLCQKTGVALEVRRPTSFSNWSIAKKKIVEGRGSVQMIYALRINGSLLNVFLPPNWKSSAKRGTYPLVVTGSYDLKQSFTSEIPEVVSRTWAESKVPVIGVLWNGGGGLNSRTVNAKARSQFNDIVQNLADHFGADPYRIVATGTSRGGATAMAMASNPEKYPYKVVGAFVSVPPADFGFLAELTGATVPFLMQAAEWTIGLLDTWKKDFRYPNLGNKMTGYTRSEAHTHILVGSKDRATMDANLSLTSPRFVNSLKSSGTQVYLVIGSHDFIVGWADQYRYARILRNAGIPMELSVNYLSGHGAVDTGMDPANLSRVMKLVATRSTASLIQTGRTTYRRNDYLQKKMVVTSGPAFTMEVPRVVTPNVEGHLIMTGLPGTQVEYEGVFSTSAQGPTSPFGLQKATLNSEGLLITKLELEAGFYKVQSVRILKPGQSKWQSLDLKQGTTNLERGTLTVEVRDVDPHPDTTAGEIADALTRTYLGAGGVSGTNGNPNLTYGIVETN